MTSFVTGVRVLFVVRAVAGAARGWYRKEGNLRTFTSIDPVPIEFTWHFDAFRILKILNFPLSASFSIFQLRKLSFPHLSSLPPSHGLGKALWVQHWDPCRDAKRYQGIPPAPVVSDVYRVYRSIDLPSKRNPFCNLRHLRFLGFVHFDETCIMIF